MQKPDDGFDDLSLDFDASLDAKEQGEKKCSTNEETESAEEMSEVLQAFRDRAKQEKDRFVRNTDSEYWVCLCFQTRAQKDEFLANSKLDILGDKYIDGEEAAEVLGIPITVDLQGWKEPRISFDGDELGYIKE